MYARSAITMRSRGIIDAMSCAVQACHNCMAMVAHKLRRKTTGQILYKRYDNYNKSNFCCRTSNEIILESFAFRENVNKKNTLWSGRLVCNADFVNKRRCYLRCSLVSHTIKNISFSGELWQCCLINDNQFKNNNY